MKSRELNFKLWEAIAKADPGEVRKQIAKGADTDAVADRRNGLVRLENKTPLWASVSLAGKTLLLSQIGPIDDSQLAKNQSDAGKKRQCYLKIIELLIRAGADTEKQSYGSTPLRIACIGNDLEVAEILLAGGANPNAGAFSPLLKVTNKFERELQRVYSGTILHEVVSKGYQGATAMLIKAGADPSLVDDEGKTAFDIARDNGGGPILKLLLQKKGKKGRH